MKIVNQLKTTNKMKKFLIFLSVLFISISASAYDFEKCSLSGGAELNANYLFRGKVLGGLNLQPWVEFSSYGLTLGAWGSTGEYHEIDNAHPFTNYWSDWNNELDLYLSYTVPGEYVTFKVTHFYYFDNKAFFNYSYKYNEDDMPTSQTEVMLEIKPSSEYPFILSTNVQVGGGDCWTADGVSFWNNDSTVANKLWSTYISLRYELEVGDWYIEPEIGFSPCRSYYTHSDRNWAINNVSCKVNYNFFSNDYVNLYALAHVHFNFFDTGIAGCKFEAYKNFGWNVGFGIDL